MLTSLALIFIAGLAAAALFSFLKLPRIVGMLLLGIAAGPYVLNYLDPKIIMISPDLRRMALIIILLKAGLSVDLEDLKRVGRPAVLLSCLPATFEIAAYTFLAPLLLPVSHIEAAVMGAVLSAVSPAVVVPRMVQLTEDRWGTDKSIPQMIMAGASCDDIFVIVLFSTFLGMAQGAALNASGFLSIPVSILSGIVVGAVCGWMLSSFFETAFMFRHCVRNSLKTLIVLGAAFLLSAAEEWLKDILPFSGLLAVVSMACVIRIKSVPFVKRRLSEKFGKLWLAAEPVLFVLVGAAVDVRYTLKAGGAAVVLILLALVVRSAGVVLCLMRTELNFKERVFCVIAYLPKATVQAAIGSVPLAAGLSCGELVLSVAVLGILITAPLGAAGMAGTYRRFLKHDV